MSGVCGIDPSMTSTGLAHISTEGKLSVSNVVSSGKDKDSLEVTVDRIFAIANEVVDWVKSCDPDLVVIENPSYRSQFGKPHERAGLWWRMVAPLVHDGYPIARVAPQTRAIYGSGAGNSAKAVVLAHARHNYTDILGHRIANDDIADAIILADLGANRRGYPLVEFDETHTRALNAVLWPTL